MPTKITLKEVAARLDPFTRAYINCALWATTDNSNEQGGEALDKNYDIGDIAGSCLMQMVRDCRSFRHEAGDLLMESGLSNERAGQDFWLTRERHGAGYWDEGIGEIGQKLTDLAHGYGEFPLYVHKGKIHGG